MADKKQDLTAVYRHSNGNIVIWGNAYAWDNSGDSPFVEETWFIPTEFADSDYFRNIIKYTNSLAKLIPKNDEIVARLKEIDRLTTENSKQEIETIRTLVSLDLMDMSRFKRMFNQNIVDTVKKTINEYQKEKK